jgi:xylulokinase
MGELAASGLELQRIAAISGSAQQHGSVYFNASARARLGALDASRPLAEQLHTIFSRDVAPIWMDSSTAAACRAIEAHVGAERLACVTGSRAFERFTGPQIRKFFETEPERYARTARVHLVSSYLASLLAGGDAPVDAADASGMNLMDLTGVRWAPDILTATAPDLDRRLPRIVPSSTVIGELSDFWVRRYGFPRARVVAWSGDNPCSLIGTGLATPGRWGISLGTSDTVFAYMPTFPNAPFSTPTAPFSTPQHPSAPLSTSTPPGGHVFASPTGAFMGLTCFKNGSLARERVRDELGLDWNGFSEALRRTQPGTCGIFLPWFEPEITPAAPAGVQMFDVPEHDAAARVRALIESQMLGMRRHSRWMGERVDVIHATGGAAASREILQVMADVFGVDVYQLQAGNSAALGAALRAYHADEHHRGRALGWDEALDGFVRRAGPPVRPNGANRDTYERLAIRHSECEASALR